ncbi:MAG: AMP-binding protein [Paracoccus sp. (in: a-proteobacteria)]
MTRPWTKTYAADVPLEIDPDVFPSTIALFDRACADYADRPVFECFGRTMTYAEVDRAARAVAAWLQQRAGVGRGDRVALMVPNIFAFPVAMLGIHRAGAAQVNVNPLYTPEELRHQLRDSGAETIVIAGGSTPTLAGIIADTSVRSVITVDPGDVIGADIPAPPPDPRLTGAVRFADVLAEGAGLALTPVALTGGDTLFLQYTGGTTGPSKGAVLSHRNLVANVAQFTAHLSGAVQPGREVVVMALPLYHIFGLMLLHAYMAGGARIILIPNPRNVRAFCEAIRDAKFTVIPGVNTMFQSLLASSAMKDVDLSALKVAIGGGAAVIRDTSEKWKALTGKHIKEGYGLSETSPILCVNPMPVSEFTETCGLPVPSTDIKLIDDEGNEVAEGEAGEICARGPQVMRGYWNNPAANASAFTPDGYFRTGDIGQFTAGGFLKIVDRKKDMVIVSGFNVYPNEVEAVVTSAPGVAECACIGVRDRRTGEALRVYVVRTPATGTSTGEIIAHCRKRLASYKVPRQIVFVDTLPKSNVGKILRRELRESAES